MHGLAFAGESGNDLADYGPLSPAEPFRIGLLQLRPSDARRIAELLAVTGRCRTAKSGPSPFPQGETEPQRVIYFSSKHGDVIVRPDGTTPLVYERGKLSQDLFGERLNIGRSDQLALFLVETSLNSLVERTEKQRRETEPPRQDTEVGPGELSPQELVELRGSVKRVLDLALTAPHLLHRQHVTVAAAAVGAFGFQEFRSALDELANRLPPPLEWEQRAIELNGEINQLTEALKAKDEPGLSEHAGDDRNFAEFTFGEDAEKKSGGVFARDPRGLGGAEEILPSPSRTFPLTAAGW